MKRMILLSSTLLLGLADLARADYPDVLNLQRANGAAVSLIYKVDSSSGRAYYVYGGGARPVNCGTGDLTSYAIGTPHDPSEVAGVLGIQAMPGVPGGAPVPTALNRSSVMADARGRHYRVSLADRRELEDLRAENGHRIPLRWTYSCPYGGPSFVQGSPEFLTADQSKRQPMVYNLRTQEARPLQKGEKRAVVLQVRSLGDAEVCLFEDTDGRGRHKCLGTGQWRQLGEFEEGGSALRAVRSVVVGRHCSAALNEDVDFGGRLVSLNLYRTVTVFRRSLTALDDRVSSLRVTCQDGN
ncbi:hypothetical protein ACWA7J_06605 [Leptothrix sp. BB-4]